MKKLKLFYILLFSTTSIAQVAPTFVSNYIIPNEFACKNFQRTSDGGYVFSADAAFQVYPNYCAGYLVKLDASGATQWAKKYTKSGYDVKPRDGCSIFQCSDNGYIIATCYYPSNGNQNICLIRTDVLGNYLWSKLYPAEGISSANCVIQTSDNGFVVCGSSSGFGQTHPYILKTDLNGNPLIGKVLNYSPNSAFATAYSINQTADGGYIACGTINNPFLMKLDMNLNIIWSKTMLANTSGKLKDVIQTSTGNYITIGTADQHLLLISADPSGNITWTKTYDEPVNSCIEGHSIKESSSSQFIASAGGFATVMQLNALGTIQWAKSQKDNAAIYSSTIESNSDGSYTIYSSGFGLTYTRVTKSNSQKEIDCLQLDAQYIPFLNSYTFINNITTSDTISSDPLSLTFETPKLVESPGCEEYSSPCEKEMFIPNVFTPNKDRLNDFFTVTLGDCIKQYDIKILTDGENNFLKLLIKIAIGMAKHYKVFYARRNLLLFDQH